MIKNILEIDMSATAKLCLIALKELSNEDGEAIATREQLKSMTGYKSKTMVVNGVKELEKRGYIEKIRRTTPNGYDIATKYVLLGF